MYSVQEEVTEHKKPAQEGRLATYVAMLRIEVYLEALQLILSYFEQLYKVTLFYEPRNAMRRNT